MASGLQISFEDQNRPFFEKILQLLETTRKVSIEVVGSGSNPVRTISTSGNCIKSLEILCLALSEASHGKESEALQNVVSKCLEKKELGGLALSYEKVLTDRDREDILFLVGAWLESLNSQENSRQALPALPFREPGARPMTLTEKIFAHHAVGETPVEGLNTGDLARIGVDWVIASEASWSGMKHTFNEIGETKIWRNDRFWIAGDHVVDPRINHVPKVQALIRAAEQAKHDFKMTEYQGLNYTIMHTEFVRERAEPGMVIIGSDSHTCSSGAMGCLAIGLGAADVVMPLVTGETWFKIPECIQINFVGKPGFGMSGKDVILHILSELKRNTVAADRIVEFSGPGAKWLSVDARFAICNMCTEFGAVTGLFVPDEVTQSYVSRRRRKANRANSVYFRPDDDANYAEIFKIDLSKVQSTLALYPSPDDVVPVGDRIGMHLDGVFIGACTTTEEELVLAALVLQVGLKKGLAMKKGKRQVTPGSLPIVEKLKSLGLLEVYEAAGFRRSLPGCSYCVGMGADQAGAGETWLSSQNRNFKNRMGPGSFGHITSAATVAASSFNMSVTDPAPFLAEIDTEFFKKYTRNDKESLLPAAEKVNYMEPHVGHVEKSESDLTLAAPMRRHLSVEDSRPPDAPSIIKSKVITLGDFIDTDAIAPAEFLVGSRTDEELGEHCMQYTYPEFREKVRSGLKVIVAGQAMGCGSSRESAVSAFKGLGVQAVIARSFSFIYSRNQPSLGLLGIVMNDDGFHEAVRDGTDIEIDFPERKIRVHSGGRPGDDDDDEEEPGKKKRKEEREFGFHMDEMEFRLTVNRGLSEAYKRFGKGIWERMTERMTERESERERERESESEREGKKKIAAAVEELETGGGLDERLKW